MMKKRPVVYVAMSGGVDSSVTAGLLVRAKTARDFTALTGRRAPQGFSGFEVIGAHMRCYNVDGCAERDAEDARRTAETLGIPFYVFDLEKEYKEKVVQYLVDGYKQGITPNPDVMCNQEIKFGIFLKKVLELGADFIATGHYVRLKQGRTQYDLYKAKDANKDQSYFLWTLTQRELSHSLFPIGSLVKPKVRQLARKFNLSNAEKKDSQGICFLGKVGLEDFLKSYLPERQGAIVTVDGALIGTHRGAHLYTIGQRHGLRIGGGTPYYVTEKDVETNTITVAPGEHPALSKKEITLGNINWISDQPKKAVMARVRYRQPVSAATISRNGAKYKMAFKRPQKFVAPGQSAVLYTKQGKMLGGGIIIK